MQNQSKVYLIILPYSKNQYFISIDGQMTPKDVLDFFKDEKLYHFVYFLEENRILQDDIIFEGQNIKEGSILYLL